jgi:hypothetical protein
MKLRTNREKSQRSEKEAAAKFGGRPQIASGALRHAKGDVKTPRYLIEDKVTDKKSYTLTKALWQKIKIEAFNRQRIPMFRTTIQGTVLCTVAEDELAHLCNCAREWEAIHKS